jgi:hypothetical protein
MRMSDPESAITHCPDQCCWMQEIGCIDGKQSLSCRTGSLEQLSARSHSSFSEDRFLCRLRGIECCPFRMRWASSTPARVIAAERKDLSPSIEAHRCLIARWFRRKATRPINKVAFYPLGHSPPLLGKGADSRLRPSMQQSLMFYSHSIVAGGFPEISYVTREIPFTSLQMRRETRSRNS